MQTNRNFLDPISKNPHFRPILMEMGFDPEQFDFPYTFRYFYDKLFKLTPKSQEKYDNYLKMFKPTNDTKLICAQVRIGGHKDNQKFFPNRSDDFLFQPVSNAKKYFLYKKHLYCLKNNYADYLQRI